MTAISTASSKAANQSPAFAGVSGPAPVQKKARKESSPFLHVTVAVG